MPSRPHLRTLADWTCVSAANETWTLPGPSLPLQTAYTYDLMGNRLTQNAGGTSTSYSYDSADELTKAVTGTTSITYSYNADGNQTTAPGATYTYDARNLLTKATLGSTSYAYAYDSAGNRVTTSVNGTVTSTSYWDLNNPLPQLATQTNGSGATTADYHYDPVRNGQSLKTAAGLFYDHHDWLGSTTDVTDSAGTDQYRYAYDSYGTTAPTALTSTPPPTYSTSPDASGV